MRQAVVTGASRGLGVYLAERLAKEGYALTLVARDEASLAAVARRLGAQSVVADLARAEDRARVVALAEARGPIEVWVNNAGVEHTVALADQSLDQIASTLEINLHAPIALTRLVLPGLLAQRRGCVVQISSMSGKGPTPWNAVYAATKHGLVGLTSSLALELQGTGVHTGVVCPGFVSEAGMWAGTGLKAPWALREVRPEQVAEAMMQVVRGRTEVLVTAGPIRPLLALQELFPGVKGPVMKRLGVLDALKARSRPKA